MNVPLRYNEYKIYELHYEKGKLIIDHKVLTKRGHVSISKEDAEVMNRGTEQTKIVYELAKDQPKDEKTTDLKRMNKAQLDEYVASNGYDVDMELTKAKIIDAINEIEN